MKIFQAVEGSDYKKRMISNLDEHKGLSVNIR
jgi:hypothetical protein